MMRNVLATACLCLTVWAGQATAQNQYSSITIFGDSLSDPGNIPKFFFGLDVPPPPYYKNQFSNGPVYAYYLGGEFGISAPFTDYAIGGAYTGTQNVGGLPGNPAIGLPNAGVNGEITLYLSANPHPTSRDLFIVWAGANDYFGYLGKFTPPAGATAAQLTSIFTAPGGPVPSAIANLVADIDRLAAIGVRNFVVPNLPYLGVTPGYNGSPTTSLPATLLASLHNQQLAQAMAQLQQQLHVNVTVVDIGTVFNDVVTNPAKYGLINVTDQCILNATCVAQQLHYVFWDGVHPTGYIQQILSDVYFASVSGPTTIGSELELDKIAEGGLFDRLSARETALRTGASGLAIDNVAGLSGTADGDSPLSAWLTGSYGWGSQGTRQNVVGFDWQNTQFVGGVDYRLTDRLAVGGAFGYAETNADLANAMGKQTVDSYQLALHVTAWSDGWFGSAAGTYTYSDWTKLHRNAFVVGQTAAATSGGLVFGARLEGGYEARWDSITLIPAVELRYARYRIGGYAESGAVGLDQAVDGQGEQSLISQIGMEARTDTNIGGYAVTPRLHVALDHEFRNPIRTIVTTLVSQPETFVATNIAATPDSWARVGAGVDVHLADAFTALLDFDSIVADGRNEGYSILGRVKFSF
ncbi:MAG TPA: autotransporter domain-containing protein [Alphaproteobacteria bacterium]|nr:autotransporter domain-containing protein [Alphaproteobacteria bacterium]